MELQARIRIVSPDKEITNEETGLTIRGSDILNQMKINNIWKNDRQGKYAGAMWDGTSFKFRAGEELVLPLSVAKHLRRMSAVCVGSDKLNGPLMPFLEITETFDMLRPVPEKVEHTQTTCPICHVAHMPVLPGIAARVQAAPKVVAWVEPAQAQISHSAPPGLDSPPRAPPA